MQPSELLEKLGESGIQPVSNQLIADAMVGCEMTALMGAPPGAESLISGEFVSSMPDASPALTQEQPSQGISFNLPTTPGMT